MFLRNLLIILALLPSEAVLCAEDPLDVSMVQLIANPQAAEGKLVRVIGFLNLEFEGDAIYLHKEDFEHGITNNAVWVSLSHDFKNRSALSANYVLLEGIFTAKSRGHMGMYNGSIKEIRRAEIWSDRGKPRAYGLPKFEMRRIDFRDADWKEALDFLVQKAGELKIKWSFEYRVDTRKSRPRITFAESDMSFRQALERILGEAGLDYELTAGRKAVIVELPANEDDNKP